MATIVILYDKDLTLNTILNLGFLRVKVYNFFCLNLGEKAVNV